MAKTTKTTTTATNGGTGAKRGRTAKTGAKKATKAAPAKKTRTRAASGADTPDLDALRATVVEAERTVRDMEAEAAKLHTEANGIVADAKARFRDVLAPYRDACKKAGVPCEFTGGRATNVSERVSFDIVKVAKGLKVTVKGRPETEEVIPMEKLKVSIGKSAYDYTDKHLGPREEIGNKGGSLQNRLRAVLRG